LKFTPPSTKRNYQFLVIPDNLTPRSSGCTRTKAVEEMYKVRYPVDTDTNWNVEIPLDINTTTKELTPPAGEMEDKPYM